MGVAGWLWLGLLACEPVEPQGGLFEAAPQAAVVGPAEAPLHAPQGPQGGFDFEAEDRDQAAAAGQDTPPEDLGAALGVDPAVAAAAEVVRLGAPSAPPPASPTPAPAMAAVVASSPADWGLRLVGTVPGAQPPRAILGLPDGTEEVVTPGAMLPSVGVVVVAIGVDVIQLAEVRAAGDHAVVSPRQLFALQPTGGGALRAP